MAPIETMEALLLSAWADSSYWRNPPQWFARYAENNKVAEFNEIGLTQQNWHSAGQPMKNAHAKPRQKNSSLYTICETSHRGQERKGNLAPDEFAPEKVWQKRIAHRQAGVSHIKSLDVYTKVAHGLPRSRTPDPTDRAISKRDWERDMQRWRSKLKERPALTRRQTEPFQEHTMAPHTVDACEHSYGATWIWEESSSAQYQ